MQIALQNGRNDVDKLPTSTLCALGRGAACERPNISLALFPKGAKASGQLSLCGRNVPRWPDRWRLFRLHQQPTRSVSGCLHRLRSKGNLGGNQLLVLKVLRLQQFQQSIAKQIRVITIVKTEAHFVKVGLQMFCANTMPRSNNAALQQREGGLNTVCVHVAVDVLAVRVADRLVFRQNTSIMQSLWITLKIIRHNYVYVLRDVLFDVLRQRSRLHIFSVKESQFATALPNADDNLLFALRMADFVLMAALLSAYKGFVNFYDPAERLRIDGLHGVSDAMAEIPRCAVVNPQHPLKLIRRHTLARLADQKRSKEPLEQRQMRVMELRIRRDGELIAA